MDGWEGNHHRPLRAANGQADASEGSDVLVEVLLMGVGVGVNIMASQRTSKRTVIAMGIIKMIVASMVGVVIVLVTEAICYSTLVGQVDSLAGPFFDSARRHQPAALH